MPAGSGDALSLGSTFGALLLSTFFSLILYGLTLQQTVRYARQYSSDRLYLKILVAAIFISDTFHSATMIHMCYHYLVASYSTPTALAVHIWTIDLLPVSTGLIVFLTQGFYTRRVYVVSLKFNPVVFFIAVLLLAELGFMTASTVVSFRNHTFQAIYRYIWMDTVLFAIVTIIDLVLTGAFIIILRQSRTGFLGTDSALDILARYALYATALISALTIPAFVCSIVLSHTFVYFAIAIPAVKVYSNSVLAVLNCRNSLPRAGTTENESERVELSVLGRHRLSSRGNPRRMGLEQAPPRIVLEISPRAASKTKHDSREVIGHRYK